MPDVLQRTRTISGRGAAVRAPSGLGQGEIAATGDVGRAISGLGDVVMQQRERQRLQDLKNKSIDIETSYDDEQRAYFSVESQLAGSDSFGNIERAEKFRESSILKHTEGVEDPELKTQIEGYIQNQSGGMMDRLSIHQASQRSEVSGQIRERKIDGILKDSFDGNKPVEESIFSWQRTILGQRETGQLGEEEAAELLVNGEEKIAEASLDGIVNRDPEAAIELIEAGAYDEFLDQKQIKAFDKQAKTLQKALDDDTKARANEARKAEQDALKQKQKETGDVFVTGVTEGSLTREQVLQSALDPTGENSKEHWLKEIEKREKKVKESIDETWETKPEVEADFIQRITEDPESVSDTEITDKLGAGLDNSTAQSLLGFKKKRLKGDKDPVKEQEEKTAIKRLSDAKASKFFAPADKVKNSKLWAENVNNLQRYIQNHPEQDLGLYVDQILEPIETSFVQNLMDIVSFGQPGEEEAIATRQEELRVEAEDPKRIQAEQILTNAGKRVTKKNIDFVMGKL